MQQKYIARRDACNVIIQVLRDSQRGFKASVLGFIRKVKIVQRMVRAHMVANSGRAQLVQTYMDELYPVLATHTGIVLADRGLDLRNMSSMDGSKVKVQLGHKQWLHIVPELNTFGFHQYLRNYQEHLSDVNTVFGASGKMLYTSAECSVIRRTCILDMVFKKRRQYVARLFAQRKLVLNIPQVTLSDVRSFIGGGVDPVQKYLVAAYRKYDASVGQQLEYQAGMKICDVDANGNKVIMMRSSCMNLLKAITPEDMGLLYVTLAEKLIEQRTLQLAQKGSSRRHTAFGKLLVMQKLQGGTSLQPMLEARLTVAAEDEDGDVEMNSGVASLRPASPPGRKGTSSLLESSRRVMTKRS